jgi:TetR/AcrR family transcriptional regulator, lmrAB and yxaGH operons repressor
VSADAKPLIERAAAELLSRDGYNGMGLKALSDATDLPYGSIYHHFPGGKEEIATVAIVGTAVAIGELLTATLVDGLTDEAVRAMFGFMADRLEASDWVAGCVVGTPALDDPSPTPSVRDACATGFAALIAPIVDALRREEMTADVAEGLATTLIAAYEGATALARVQRSRAPLDAAAEAMIRLVAASR